MLSNIVRCTKKVCWKACFSLHSSVTVIYNQTSPSPKKNKPKTKKPPCLSYLIAAKREMPSGAPAAFPTQGELPGAGRSPEWDCRGSKSSPSCPQHHPAPGNGNPTALKVLGFGVGAGGVLGQVQSSPTLELTLILVWFLFWWQCNSRVITAW